MPKINPVLQQRTLTEYRSDCVVENEYMNKLNVNNSRDFKSRLMSNGDNLMTSQNQTIVNSLKNLEYSSKF